jgi:glycosyltransferase involved in cell wall biosynthesis
MKVLHLVAGKLNGGAARGAYWLHLAQREIGIDSTLITNHHQSVRDESVITLAASNYQRTRNAGVARLGNLPVYLYSKRKNRIFNTGFSGINFTKHPAYRSADLIHLHWINGLVAMRTLRKVKKPIVWTMRDMWPFTGGCHYAIDCDRYKVGCGKCPQLFSKNHYDLTKLVVANKRSALPKQLQVVGISEWLTDCALNSYVFQGHQIQTISNNIDTRQFLPFEARAAREALGLPQNKKILLIGAQNINDFYKGFDLFLSALGNLASRDMHIVTFGREPGNLLGSLGFGYTSLGFLADTVSLRLAYSAADVFVAPSRLDAFGKTLAEAMACGTPVVCFDAAGPKDIVDHKVTGYKSQPFEPADMANGIDWILGLERDEYAELRKNARIRAVELFDSLVIAKYYKNLYLQMIKDVPAAN